MAKKTEITEMAKKTEIMGRRLCCTGLVLALIAVLLLNVVHMTIVGNILSVCAAGLLFIGIPNYVGGIILGNECPESYR